MDVTVQQLIGKLPPYLDQWEVIHPDQTVKHIMREVLEAHDQFADYYDSIALCFDADTTVKVCDKIYSFLKSNIKYQEETEDDQTSALPTGLLIRGHGDCKHYAGFTAGILDALTRAGRKIDWCYVFASYKVMNDTPHHVFVEVNVNGEQYWIDPTPGSDAKDPAWVIRKKIKADGMLRRNIAGIYDNSEETLYVTDNGMMSGRPYWQLMPVEGVRGADGNHGTNKYFTGPFLALQHYLEDPYSVEGTNWQTTADAINAAIANGPEPGHTVNADFVKWIYNGSNKGWNFYYPMGVQEGYEPAVPLPSWYPKLVITDDGKLQFDRFYAIDDYMNDEIHAITAWTQAKINERGIDIFPTTPRQLKEFSQGKEGDDLFKEARGESLLQDIWKGFAFWNLYSMRGAYLNLVRANWFHVGEKLWNCLHNDDGTIDQTGYSKVRSVWFDVFGGNMDHIVTASENGKYKPAVDTQGNTMGEVITFAAIVAAAGVIIAAMGTAISQILKAKGDRDGKDYLTNPATGLPYPPMPTGTGTGTGTGFNPGDIINKIKENPLPFAALGVGAYLVLKKKKKQVTGITDDILPLALIGVGIYFIFFNKPGTGGSLTVAQKRAALIAMAPDEEANHPAFSKMTDSEIIDSYDWVFTYNHNIAITPKDLILRITAISEKYNIFT